jgi:hypothetical protein
LDLEYSDWLKSSRTIALDFCKTMLTAASAAIGVYFAVLKYLGTETVTRSKASWLSIGPPVLFLASVAFFALGLRPRLAPVRRDEFEDYRARRLTTINIFLTIGLALFVAGLIFAFVSFVWSLNLI